MRLLGRSFWYNFGMKTFFYSVVILMLFAVSACQSVSQKDEEELNRQVEARLRQRYGFMQALVFMRNCPKGTVVDKSILGVKEIPAEGWGRRAYLEADVKAVIGRKVAEDRRRGDVIIKSDLCD